MTTQEPEDFAVAARQPEPSPFDRASEDGPGEDDGARRPFGEREREEIAAAPTEHFSMEEAIEPEPVEEAELPAEEPEEASADAEEEPPADDAFASWPQAQSEVQSSTVSSAVVEDPPAAGEDSNEHAGGEIDVPLGYAVIEGKPVGRRRAVAIVVARFNGGLTNRMLARAIEALEEAGVPPEGVTVVPVPGAFELPIAAMAMAKTRRYACVVALGAVVRGETPHFEFVASEAASGIQLAGIETGIPVSFGVLTVDTVEQGEDRIDRAADAARSALEMADVFAQLRATARS